MILALCKTTVKLFREKKFINFIYLAVQYSFLKTIFHHGAQDEEI